MVTDMIEQLSIVLLAALFISCGSDVLTKKDLMGQWHDEHNGILVLKTDGAFVGTNLSANKLVETISDPSTINDRVVSSYQGTWKIICDYDHCNVVLSVKDTSSKPNTYAVPFIARGSGLFNSGKIERLERWLDSDGVDVYELTRIEASR